MAEQVFVAREYELERLSSFLDRNLAGEGHVCFVTGNAGSGKTALVSEFIHRAQEVHPDHRQRSGGRVHHPGRERRRERQYPPVARPIPRSWAGQRNVGDSESARSDLETALAASRTAGDQQQGWRALLELGELWASRDYAQTGQYGRALEFARTGLAIAEEIQHRHWMVGAHFALGALHLDLLALSNAREHLEQALALAQEVGSLFWLRCVGGMLAETCVQQGELELAESVLRGASEPDAPFETMAQRLVGWAWSDWARASGQPALALRIADRLVASAINLSPGEVIPLLSKLRGQALADLDRMDDAEGELQAALRAAQGQGSRPLQWRLHRALGDLYERLDRQEDAGRELLAAQTIVGELAANIPDATLRNNFEVRANSRGWR